MIFPVRTALATLAFALGANAAALAVPTPTAADAAAFLHTAGSGSMSCNAMYDFAKEAGSAPTNESSWKMAAANASVCLLVIRNVTSDPVPARVPRFVLISSCRWISNNAEYSIKACDGVPQS